MKILLISGKYVVKLINQIFKIVVAIEDESNILIKMRIRVVDGSLKKFDL